MSSIKKSRLHNFLTSLVRYFDAVCNVDLNRLFLGRAYYPDAINEASKKLKHWIFFLFILGNE